MGPQSGNSAPLIAKVVPGSHECLFLAGWKPSGGEDGAVSLWDLRSTSIAPASTSIRAPDGGELKIEPPVPEFPAGLGFPTPGPELMGICVCSFPQNKLNMNGVVAKDVIGLSDVNQDVLEKWNAQLSDDM